jgi:HEPN domain-containing protein
MSKNERAATVVREWVIKAENDLKNAAHTLKMGNACPTDTVCFHAQQCVEKCLKALLVACRTESPKTHDLGQLVALLPRRLRPSLDDEEQDRLTDYATVTRYPGDYEPISLGEACEAVKIARRVRREVRKLLEKKPLF